MKIETITVAGGGGGIVAGGGGGYGCTYLGTIGGNDAPPHYHLPTHIGIGAVAVAPETQETLDRSGLPIAGRLCQILTNAPRGYVRAYVLSNPHVWTGPHIVKAELVQVEG